MSPGRRPIFVAMANDPTVHRGLLALALVVGAGAGLAVAGEPPTQAIEALAYFHDSILQAALDHAALGFGCFR